MNDQEAARKILAEIDAIYKPAHEYVTVDVREFGHLDLKFYRQTTCWLEANDFVHLEDKEDLTLAKTPGNLLRRVMIRVMRTQDGSIMAGLYHPKLRPLWLRLLLFLLGKRLGRIVDFETEFSDGSFVCTTNAATASAVKSPAIIATEYLPAKTPVAHSLARHRERVAAHLRAHPGIVVRKAMSSGEIVAAQNRMNAIKAAFRGELGGISLEELQVLSPSPDLAASVHAEIRKQRSGPDSG